MANRMSGFRTALRIAFALGSSAAAVLAGGQDDWAAKKSESAPYCSALEGLVKQQTSKARAIKQALSESETGAPSSVMEMAQRAMGNPYESDWQREQKRLIEKHKAEAIELNERYKDQRCGSVDIEQELARAPSEDELKPTK